MLKVRFRTEIIKIPVLEIKDVDELQKYLPMKDYTSNRFEILAGSVQEVLKFIDLFRFDMLRKITNLEKQTFELWYNPFSYCNLIYIKDEEVYSKVKYYMEVC